MTYNHKINRYQSALLNTYSGIEHGFFGRNGGVSIAPLDSLNCIFKEADSVQNVAENRRRILETFAVLPALVTLKQMHTPTVHRVTAPAWTPSTAPEGDALVTTEKNVALGVQTADCVPLLFCDPENQVIGAAHAGWKGLFSGVIAATLHQMVKAGAVLENIVVAIGPAIDQKCYEFGPVEKKMFTDKDAKLEQFFQKQKKDKYLFDPKGVAVYLLQNAGVGKIDDLKLDTFSNPDLFFSCRYAKAHGNGQFGGQLSIIFLKGL